MAYQNVGTPRFYINTLEWLDSVGYVAIQDEVFRTLPVERKADIGVTGHTVTALSDKSFTAWLGHANGGGGQLNISVPYTDKIQINANLGLSNQLLPQYDGFSIRSFDGTLETTLDTFFTPNCGSVVVGTYYDMPHSPDLSLTMSREMDGVKKIRTKGGADLINHKYTKPNMWGEMGAWELKQPLGSGYIQPQELSMSGRRTWDLSFSYLQDSDVFGASQLVAHPSVWGIIDTAGSPTTFDTEDVNASGGAVWDLLSNDNFYSQVIHKTNGGQLPFIFQPNRDDNTNFAICKFDMNSFKFEQVANGVYNISLKIREVW